MTHVVAEVGLGLEGLAQELGADHRLGVHLGKSSLLTFHSFRDSS